MKNELTPNMQYRSFRVRNHLDQGERRCTIAITPDKDLVGLAITSPEDVYNKKLGQMIADGRSVCPKTRMRILSVETEADATVVRTTLTHPRGGALSFVHDEDKYGSYEWYAQIQRAAYALQSWDSMTPNQRKALGTPASYFSKY